MACIVKAAEVVVVVVVVVVVLGGGHGGRCHAGHLAINCNSNTEITRSGEEKSIHSEEIRQARETVSENLYMVPLTGFEGVRAKVTTNMGTFTAWFPIMNHCPIGDSRWWQVLLEVKKHTSSTLTANLRVHNCFLSCELITDATRTNGRDLKLHNLDLFGRGASKWRTQRPESPCHVEKLANYSQTQILTSCTNPPPIGSASPPHSNTEQQPTHETTQQNTHKTTQQNTHKTTQQNTHKTTQQNTRKTTQQNTHEILITTSPPVTSSSVPESRAHQHKGLTSIQLGGGSGGSDSGDSDDDGCGASHHKTSSSTRK
ncbi:uncharacterized protein LOC135095332 [Scylla paramamosain]|uniref:uncharacterized protein LOC135095332 n=1 Tax=Scylla paramamosain TaxID=85552 RepID=UPI0030839819